LKKAYFLLKINIHICFLQVWNYFCWQKQYSWKLYVGDEFKE